MALLWPAEDPIPAQGDPTMGWRDVSASVVVRQIPGDHLSSVTRHVDDLAMELRALLASPGN